MLFMQVTPQTTTNLAEGSSAKLDMELARKRSAIIGFALDTSCKYCSAVLSTGSILLYDIQVAKKYNNKVREAALRMGSTAEELDVSFPMHDQTYHEQNDRKLSLRPRVVVMPKYPRPVQVVASPESAGKEEEREEGEDYSLPCERKGI